MYQWFESLDLQDLSYNLLNFNITEAQYGLGMKWFLLNECSSNLSTIEEEDPICYSLFNTIQIMCLSIALIFKVFSTILTGNLSFPKMKFLHMSATVTPITKNLSTILTLELFHTWVDRIVCELNHMIWRIYKGI